MARSPSHKFGQIIGEILEEMMHAPLAEIAEKHDLYLDYRHKRPARAGRKKVIWKDRLGNAHDLDYVLEQGGAEDVQGRPKAFIESAWRRYTKHSRNKAQEIQGAIVPLAETYADCKPFLAVTLAGVFTENSLKQLESHEFSILYIPYKSILKAFSAVGINAAFDERTPDAELQSKVDAYEALNPKRKCKIVTTLKRAH